MDVKKNTNYSRSFLPEENLNFNSRNSNATKIKNEVANAFEQEFAGAHQLVHIPQLTRSISMETHQQVDFSKIPVHARSGLSIVMEKHNEMRRRRTGTPNTSVLEDKNVNIFFVKP